MKFAALLKAIKSSGIPVKINIDKSGSNIAALEDINECLSEKEQIEIRQNKYLKNIIEQEHRFIKKIIRPMLGFKSEHSTNATLHGIELHSMLRKDQLKNPSNQNIIEQFFSLVA